MKILLILEHYYPHVGGLETLFKSLSESLAKNNHEVTVITTLHDRKLARVETINGVNVKRYPFVNRYGFTLLAFIPSFIQARKHDVIQTTSYNAGLPAYFAGIFSKKPVVITFHEIWDTIWYQLPTLKSWQRTLFYKFERILLRKRFSKFIAVSKYTLEAMHKFGLERKQTTLIYNGINYPENWNYRITDRPTQPFRLLYFGRLGISKGLNVLLESLIPLRTRDIEVVIVSGKKPRNLYHLCQDLISKNELGPIIEWKSNLPFNQLQQEIKKASAVVIPSYSEGFCFAAVETIMLNTPIIHSNKGALGEVVGGRFLTYNHPNPNSLSQAIIRAMNNDWMDKPVKQFTLADSVNQYENLYRELLSQ